MFIELRDISVHYKRPVNCYALNKLSLQVEKGEMIAIMGPSGCGKTTLINVLAGLTTITSGEYYYQNQLLSKDTSQLTKHRFENIGIVLQNFALLNDRNALDNIRIGCKNKQDLRHVDKITSEIGIKHRLKSYPYQLSGGECQKVAIARALISEPSIILADEPTGALDGNSSNEIMDLFEQIHVKNRTIIIVTHDKTVAERCTRIIQMKDGTIMQSTADG